MAQRTGHSVSDKVAEVFLKVSRDVSVDIVVAVPARSAETTKAVAAVATRDSSEDALRLEAAVVGVAAVEAVACGLRAEDASALATT